MTLRDDFKALREAGGDAWDNVEDPERFLGRGPLAAWDDVMSAWEGDWPATNRRRGELVDKEIAGALTNVEAVELAALQAFADYYIDKTTPRPTELLEQLEKRVESISARLGEPCTRPEFHVEVPADDPGVLLAKCQAFNASLMRHITGLIQTIEAGNPPPNHATLKATLEKMVALAAKAAAEIA